MSSPASEFGEGKMENWHYTDLLKAHKLFIHEEGRFKLYDAYMKASKPGVWLESPHVPLIEGLLLFGWVHSWDPNFQGDLVKFFKIYEEIFPIIKGFEHGTIVNANFTTYVKNSLGMIFDRIANCCRSRRFESTDTSKILHAIIPDLFVMWDDKIKEKLIGVRESGKTYDGKCYADEFLPDMQNFAKRFLDSYVEENGGDHEDASRQISQLADGYTLAKLLDQLNYVRFTKKKSMAEIRSISLKN